MTSNTWYCKICAAPKKSGQLAALLPSGLLGPVRLLVTDVLEEGLLNIGK